MTSHSERLILAFGASACALLVIAATVAAAAAPRPQVAVYFVHGEQLMPVGRPGTSALNAVRQLIKGPTRAERARGFRSYVPATTGVRHVTVANGLATVDLTEPFATGNPDGMLARLAQFVRTLTGLQGTTRVQLLVNGTATAGMFPGVPTGRPITLRFLETPNVPVPNRPEAKLPAPDPAVKATQQRLITLGYLRRGDDDGRFGPATQNAILAFQKWERLDRTGLLDKRTKSRLVTTARPTPVTRGSAGKRAEILLDRQVALLINNDKVVRTIAVSSGKPSTPTPPGDYRVYAKIPRWWSVPFREWLPYALPFVGGIAFHEFADVPAYPASHGCVRQSWTVASWTYDFAYVGMPVKVIADSDSLRSASRANQTIQAVAPNPTRQGRAHFRDHLPSAASTRTSSPAAK
jgi:peptidoglycan hydrolase-like protein with peptidoglycan-binding domain